MSWREEARQDRLVRARIEQGQAAAAAQVRIAERAAAAAQRRDGDAARTAARDQARRAAAARHAARAGWVREHVIDLLFVPVIAVPGVLAWTAMAAYGAALYGPAGWALPAFSEGAMWAFAAANTLTRHRHPGAPTWHLQAGTWAFAAVGAALNFAHGLAPDPGHPHGIAAGAVMAVVSAAGVTAHQLVTAGPRRSRHDRDAARIARAAARRELAVRRAAVSAAPAALDSGGGARLVFRPGLVTVTRRGRLAPAVVPGLPVTPAADEDGWDTALTALTAAAGTATGVTGPGHGPDDGDPGPVPAARPDGPGNGPAPGTVAALADLARAAMARGELPPDPSQRALRDLLSIRMARAAQVQRALRTPRRNP
jgi:hypothetical protein